MIDGNNIKRSWFFFLIPVVVFSNVLFGQVPLNHVPQRDIDNYGNVNAEVKNAQDILAREGRFPSSRFPSSINIVPTLKLSKESKKKLQVGKDEVAAYRDFLKQKNTGIFKLLVFPDCGKTQNDEEKKKCLLDLITISQQASSYSFRSKEYNSIQYADLSLLNGSLTTLPFMTFSFMVDLKDVPLDELSLNSEGIKYLAEYKIPEALKVANEQISAFNKVIEAGKHVYFRAMSVSENRTFAIRSSGYKTKSVFTAFVKTDDVIVVFRIIRKDSDGSVTILWKELKRQSGIKLKCPGFCFEEAN